MGKYRRPTTAMSEAQPARRGASTAMTRPAAGTSVYSSKGKAVPNRAETWFKREQAKKKAARQRRIDELTPTDIQAQGDIEGRKRRRGIGGLQTPMTSRETIG